VDLVRRHARRRAGAQSPGIECIAARPRVHAGIAGRPGALADQFGELGFQHRRDLRANDVPCPHRPLAGNPLFASPPLDRSDQIAAAPLRAHRRKGGTHLSDRLMDQELRRDHPLRCGGAQPLSFPRQHSGKLFQPGKIGLGIGGGLDRVVGIQKARHIEIRADILDHDIRRVAPRTHRDVAIGQRKPVERRAIGAFDDGQAGARHRIGCAAGNRLNSRHLLAQQGCHGGLARC